MDAEIRNITLERIFANPHRDIENYPINDAKVEALMRSIENGNVGLWPSLIARRTTATYQIAFGHHRVVAAGKLGLKTIPLIVMDLDDQQMLQYMARENAEDFGTDFMVLLNTWEAGVNFVSRGASGNPEPLVVARLLGWTYRGQRDTSDAMTFAALACNNAFKLIQGGYMQRAEFAGLTVEVARNIAQRAMSMMATVEKQKGEPAPLQEWRKEQIGKAAKTTARDVREGKIAKKDVRAKMDDRAFTGLNQKPMPKPLFDKFAYTLCTNLNAMINHDGAAERLAQIEVSLTHVELDVDRAALSAVRGSLGQLGQRANNWFARLKEGDKEQQPGATPLLKKRGE